MKESRPSAYFQWADAFPLVYGGTVTELAEKNKCINDDLMGLTSP
jgi:hypothetical protein